MSPNETPAKTSSRKNKKEKKKKSPLARFITGFFVTLFVLAAALAGAVAYLYYTTDPQVLITRISDELYKQYRRELSVGNVQVSILKGIYIEGIKISERGGFVEGTAVKFKEGSVVYNPFALLAGRIDILKISIGGFYSTYERTMSLINDFTKTSSSQGGSPAKLSFKLREIEVYDSQFVYLDIPLNFEVRAVPDFNDIYNTALRLKIYSVYGELSFVGKVSDGQLYVDGLKTAPFTGGALDVTVNRLQVELHLKDSTHYSLVCKDLDAQYGTLKLSTYSDFTGSYNTKVKSVELKELGLKINDSKIFADSLSYALNTKTLRAELSSIDAAASDLLPGAKGSVTGNLSLVYSRKIRLSGRLVVENFSYKIVRDANAQINFDENRTTGSMNLSSDCGDVSVTLGSDDLASLPLSVRVKSDAFTLDPLLAMFSAQNGQGSGASGSTNAGASSGAASLPIAGIALEVQVGDLKYKNFDLQSVSLSASYDGRIASVGNLSLVFMKGNLQANGDLMNGIFAGQLTYSKGKLKEFSKLMLSGNENISGTVDLSGKFRIDVADFYNSIADLQVKVSDGVIENLIIQNKISKLLYNIPLDYILYDSIELHAVMNDRVLGLQSLAFDSDQIRLNASGTLALDGGKLSADSTLSIEKAYLSPLPNFTRIFTSGYESDGWVNFRIGVENTLKEPKVKLLPRQ